MLTIAALTTEINTDPLTLGYSAKVTAKNDQAIADLLNATTGPGSATITLTSVPHDTFALGISPAVLALGSASTALQAKYNPLITLLSGSQNVTVSSAQLQAVFAAMIADGMITQAQIDAFTKRIGSRAEVLWGSGTVITSTNVANALGRF